MVGNLYAQREYVQLFNQEVKIVIAAAYFFSVFATSVIVTNFLT